jgi:hypothetical protein
VEIVPSGQIKHAWFVAYSYTDHAGTFHLGNNMVWTLFYCIESQDDIETMESIVNESLRLEGAGSQKIAISNYKREAGADKLFPVDTRPRLARAK